MEVHNTKVNKLFHEDESAEITGTVIKIDNNGKYTFITLSQPVEIKAMAFSNVSLKEGQQIKIIGKKDEDLLIVEKIIQE